jgi:hypothetical protein
MVVPRNRSDWRFLQDKKIVATAPGPFTHPHPQVVPSDKVDAFVAIRDTVMMRLAQAERVDPTH